MVDVGNLDTKLESYLKSSFTIAKMGHFDVMLWVTWNYFHNDKIV